MASNPGRRLIVNADDFGRSSAANHAIIQAHRNGILTSASLMVSGQAWAEAVELAHENPLLGVGLHLTLVCGQSVLPPSQIPQLVDSAGFFSSNPTLAGWRYFFDRGIQPALYQEINAQFSRFHSTGLILDHVNGHLNIHLHPRLFSLLMHHRHAWKIDRMRLTRDSFSLSLRLGRGRWLYRLSHALIFGCLARRSAPVLSQNGIRHASSVFGLLQTGLMTEDYVLKLLPRLPEGDSELYSHPSLDQAPQEYEALISPQVKEQVERLGLRLIRYQDL